MTTLKYKAPVIPFRIPALRKLGKKTTVVLCGHGLLGDEIRLGDEHGQLLGYLRHSPWHEVHYLMPGTVGDGAGGIYAVTVNGICTHVYREAYRQKQNVQGALNELGDIIVDQKTRRKPLRKKVNVLP